MLAKKIWFWIVAILVVIGLVIGFIFLRPYQYHGTVITPAKPAPDFSLTDTQGQAFDLSSQKGQIILLFFGYTNCPDECPTTLAMMKQVWAGFGNKTDQVKFDFITVDPDRDSPQVIRLWLDKFNPDFIGLTGSMAQLQSVWQAYGVTVIKNNDGPNYSVTHPLNIYLVDKQGDVFIIYPYPSTSTDIFNDVIHLLNS